MSGPRATDQFRHDRLPGSFRGADASWSVRAHLPAVLDLPALAVCLFQVVFVALQAVRVPLGSFDAWSLWEYKGRRFWLDGGLSGGFLHDHAAIFAHPAYPPLVPLLIAWVYTWLGVADPALIKPLFPAFFASLLLAFYGALRPRLGGRGALLATAALALVPSVARYAGTGLADVPLAAALVAVAAALARWHEQGDRRSLLAAGLLLGVALLIKRDALFFSVAALCAVGLLARSWRVALRFVLPACAIAGPWYAYVKLTGVPDRDFLPLTPHNLLSHGDRIGGIARLFSLNLLASDQWSVLWYAFAALLLAGLVQRRVRAAVLLLPVLAPLTMYVVSLSLSAWPDYMLHVRTSLDRLILVTTPFALWFVAEQLRPALQFQQHGGNGPKGAEIARRA
ncbi:MAG TPA: glycosyltransferase family 39 protein [Chloroflexota bacterium]|nr:glycosyltransferase family 39 protein [Chloroflexota bacterium]